jgi:purine-nucleoside/S-methyl-5'-thioadenosine phosphorylase / adenosine deaminase
MTSISVTTSSTSRRSSANAVATHLAGAPVQALWTGVAEGDLRTLGPGPPPAPVPRGLTLRRLRQVHGADIVVVDSPVPDGALAWGSGTRGAPPEGDGVVASGDGFVLAVLTADCASVALGSPEGVFGAVHVGWRGLTAGVVARAIDTMATLGATDVVAGVGPCIGPCCYEFSGDDLDAMVRSCGPSVRAVTTWGSPSLDLPTAVRGQLSLSGASVVAATDACTSCSAGYFSHRARGDVARQALLVWRQQ